MQIADSIISNFDFYKELNVNAIIPSLVNSYLRPFLLTGYLAASLYLVGKKHLSIKSEKDPKILSHYLVTKNWSYFILLVVTLSIISYFIVISVFYDQGIDEAKASAYKWQFLSAAMFALIPASMLLYPQLVYGFISLEDDNRTLIARRVHSATFTTQNLYSDKAIDEAPIIGLDNNVSQLKEAIESYFNDESPYLNPQLKVADVASFLGVPPHHINFCFSVAFDENFAQYKTRYRIEHALKLLRENASETYSIEAIGNMSGFASKSNFFKAFKLATGMTPQEYVASMQSHKPENS